MAASALSSTRDAVAELKARLGEADFQHIVVFFAIEHDAQVLVDALAEAFPGVPVSGCSTAGEIGPAGMMQGGVMLIAFPRDGFRVYSDLIPDIDRFGVERATATVRRLKAQVAAQSQRPGQRQRVRAAAGRRAFQRRGDASSRRSIGRSTTSSSSAGRPATASRSGARRSSTTAAWRSARPILMMIESDYPFCVFKTQNFEPTPIKLVVTAADTENRIVHELNGELASREYAAAIGLMPNDLGPFSFASYPLVVKVGGDYYCRSIRNMNPDGSLSFFCAIDEGLVLTVARPQDMLRSTASTLEEIDAKMGGIDLVVGFDCILRRLDAETRQIRHQMDALYRKYSVAGFHTYGEQFNAMHLNQTLTGIAFGQRTTGT